MTKTPIEAKVIAEVAEAQHPRNVRAMLMVLADAAHSIPDDYITTVTVTTGWDENLKTEAVTYHLTGTPP